MAPHVILIDPGHGGEDPGVIAPDMSVDYAKPMNGPLLIEKRTTLAIALMAREALLGLGWDLAAEMTRDEDEGLSLHARGALAEKYSADLVLSLHVNSNPNPKTSGAILFVRPGDITSRRVAFAIQQSLPDEVRRTVHWYFETQPAEAWLNRARNVLEAYVPKPRHGEPPRQAPTTVLVEMAHASNDKDRTEIEDERVRRAIVAAIIAGVARYLAISEKELAPFVGVV